MIVIIKKIERFDYHCVLIALNMFYVNNIYAFNVALAFPYSSAPLSNLDGLPTLFYNFLYSANNLAFSSFLSLSWCSLLSKSA